MPMTVFFLSAVILCQFKYVGTIGEYSAFTVLQVHVCGSFM